MVMVNFALIHVSVGTDEGLLLVLGAMEGIVEGIGEIVGAREGLFEGYFVGAKVGDIVGFLDGAFVGDVDGANVGTIIGLAMGECVGMVGLLVGGELGLLLTDGLDDGGVDGSEVIGSSPNGSHFTLHVCGHFDLNFFNLQKSALMDPLLHFPS